MNNDERSYTSLHLFCGMGGDALGFRNAGFEVLAGLDGFAEDADADTQRKSLEACEDFRRLVGAPCYNRNLAELMPDELVELVGPRRPDVLVLSPPCKGFSGCLPRRRAREKKYIDLNSLGERALWMALEAWETPPALILLENVPRINSEGREWLDAISAMLSSYGYANRETSHDCGVLGGLAQHRRRFLLVARHCEQLTNFLHEPPSRRVRGIGEVLGQLPVPLPNDSAGGPMHQLGKLCAKNWVRLALIPPGGDWRDLPEEVALKENPSRHNGCYGLRGWADASMVIGARQKVSRSWRCVADPRVTERSGRQNGGFGVNCWEAPSHTVTAHQDTANTWGSVADPRVPSAPRAGAYGVVAASSPAWTVVGHANADNSAVIFADPRVEKPRHEGSVGTTHWCAPSTTVIGSAQVSNGPWQVCDPRIGYEPRAGQLGVIDEEDPAPTVQGNHRPGHAGAASVADSRVAKPTHFLLDTDPPTILGPKMPWDNVRKHIHLIILALDGTWHRPMTPLELALLQGFPAKVDGDWLTLTGDSKARWIERIGNAIPPPTAEAIANSCLRTLQTSARGELVMFGEPVWVRRPSRCTEDVDGISPGHVGA